MRCVGIGVYHLGPGGIERPGDFGWRLDNVDGQEVHQIAMHCPRYGVCYQFVRRAAAGDHAGKRWWCWDGNYEQPTITPSIGCDSHPARCGRHMSIVAGKLL